MCLNISSSWFLIFWLGHLIGLQCLIFFCSFSFWCNEDFHVKNFLYSWLGNLVYSHSDTIAINCNTGMPASSILLNILSEVGSVVTGIVCVKSKWYYNWIRKLLFRDKLFASCCSFAPYLDFFSLPKLILWHELMSSW